MKLVFLKLVINSSAKMSVYQTHWSYVGQEVKGGSQRIVCITQAQGSAIYLVRSPCSGPASIVRPHPTYMAPTIPGIALPPLAPEPFARKSAARG